MSSASRTIPIIYKPDVWKSQQSQRRLPKYHDSDKNRSHSRYSEDFRYSLDNESDNGMPYSFDADAQHQSSSMRQTWDDKFRKVAPRADNWTLANSISERLSPVDDSSIVSSTSDDWNVAGKFSTQNAIVHDRSGRRKFCLEYDLGNYKPEEITVKISGKFVTVHGRHEEDGRLEPSIKEYYRRYLLPPEVKPELLTSKLSVAGILTIEAPITAVGTDKEVIIPVKYGY